MHPDTGMEDPAYGWRRGRGAGGESHRIPHRPAGRPTPPEG